MILGIQRYASLFEELGVPMPIADSPSYAQDAARRALRGWNLLMQRDSEAILPIVEQFFKELETVYGESTVNALRSWALRFFVDSQSKNCWWIWSMKLLTLAGAYDPRLPVVSSPFRPEVTACIVDVVRSRFSHELNTQRQAKLNRLEAEIPITREEEQWLALEVIDIDLNEASIDMRLIVEEFLLRVSAFRAWQALNECVGPPEYAELVEWARRESTQDESMSPEMAQHLIQLPSPIA
jgi:hypothetical protein